MQKMNKNGFSRCAEMYIERLRKEGRYSTAHVYKNALLSFTTFCGTFNVSFRQVTRGRLRCYGQYLYECGLKPNTVSTYMRMLRSIYNRGVESGSAPYVHRLFHDVYTGVDIRQKKALPVAELHRLLYDDPKSERLRHTQTIAALMFQFCGMSFADLAHLEKSSLDSNVLRYNRIKTKTPMSVEVLDTAKEMINIPISKSIIPGIIARTISPGSRSFHMQVMIPTAAPPANTSRLMLLVLRSCQAAVPKKTKNRFILSPPFSSHSMSTIQDVPPHPSVLPAHRIS